MPKTFAVFGIQFCICRERSGLYHGKWLHRHYKFSKKKLLNPKNQGHLHQVPKQETLIATQYVDMTYSPHISAPT